MSWDDYQWGAQGEVQRAIEKYVTCGDMDALTKLMNAPWAKTDVGQAMLKEAIERAKRNAAQERRNKDHAELFRGTYERNWS